MSNTHILIHQVETLLLAFVVVGLCARRRVAYCWSFFVYLLAVFTINRSMIHWPERFWVFSFYMTTEIVFVVLKILIAVEVWLRSFACFPRARVRVGLLLTAALAATAVAAWMTPSELGIREGFIGVLNPRLQAGSLVLYAIVVSAVWWYRVPLHPLYRAILGGFAIYLIVYASMLSFAVWDGFSSLARLGHLILGPAAYVAAITWWARASWQPHRAPGPVLARLQPWARSW